MLTGLVLFNYVSFFKLKLTLEIFEVKEAKLILTHV